MPDRAMARQQVTRGGIVGSWAAKDERIRPIEPIHHLHGSSDSAGDIERAGIAGFIVTIVYLLQASVLLLESPEHS